jgi:cold shock CspA family protein
MRTHGTLSKWHDDRGFGFISPADGGADLFAHVSAFPRDGRRPTVGEIVSYEIETGTDGKTRAVKIMRPGQRRRSGRHRHAERDTPSSRLVESVLAILLFGGIVGYAYRQVHKAEPAAASAPNASIAASATSPFRCDGRTTCPQMTSCAEARYFVQHCPNTTMDGNGDGEPCEQQWCNADAD